MEIRFVSTLSPEEESAVAVSLLRAVTAFLDRIPIAYSLRIETASGRTFDHVSCPEDPADGMFGSTPGVDTAGPPGDALRYEGVPKRRVSQ
jgi:hypothetical protein